MIEDLTDATTQSRQLIWWTCWDTSPVCWPVDGPSNAALCRDSARGATMFGKWGSSSWLFSWYFSNCKSKQAAS